MGTVNIELRGFIVLYGWLSPHVLSFNLNFDINFLKNVSEVFLLDLFYWLVFIYYTVLGFIQIFPFKYIMYSCHRHLLPVLSFGTPPQFHFYAMIKYPNKRQLRRAKRKGFIWFAILEHSPSWRGS